MKDIGAFLVLCKTIFDRGEVILLKKAGGSNEKKI